MKTMKTNGIKTVDLVKAGAELNYLLGLAPFIELYANTNYELKKDILFATTLILSKDKITEETKRIILILKEEKEVNQTRTK